MRRFFTVALPAFLTDAGFYLALFTLSHALEAAGASAARVALVFGVYNLAYMFTAPLLGRLSDRHRGASVLAGGLVFAIVYTVLGGLLVLEAGPSGLSVALRVEGELALVCYGAMACMALANALFWPAFQARIADREPDPESLEAAIRAFNVAWTAGKSAGFLAGGLLFVVAPQACLWLVTVAGWAVVACALFDRTPKGEGGAGAESVRSSVAQGRKGAFLLAALLANFALWGAVSTLKGLAPTLAHGWEIDPRQTGILLAGMLAAQGVGFMALQSGRWTYRPRLLAIALPVACLGLVGLISARGLALAFPAALMIGWAQAVTYAASVYYSLDYDERRGLRTGIHEAVLAAGGCLPILGGWFADKSGNELASLWLMLALGSAIALAVGLLLFRAEPAQEARGSDSRSTP